MAESIKHRRKKHEPDRINLEDWANAGALDGLLSFLEIPPEQAPVNQGPTKVLTLLERRQKARSAPADSAVAGQPALPPPAESPAPGQPAGPSPPESLTAGQPVQPPSAEPITGRGIPQPLAPEVTEKSGLEATKLPPPVIDNSWRHPKQATGLGNKKLYRCTLAQHGHSHIEEALYQILWRTGNPESEDTRLTVMGYGEMGRCIHLSINNVKAACQRLIAKLSIEEAAREVSHQCQGKTYRVFSYRSILERRKAAGLIWVVRNKGVEFVTPSDADLAITDPPPVIESAPLPVIESAITGPPSITGTPVYQILPCTSSIDKLYIGRSSSSEVALVLRALSEYGDDDDDVALQLLSQCRQLVPDCTIPEVVHFIHQKGALIRRDRNRKIANPMGFLLTAVPKCFAGETFERYRREEKNRQEEERAFHERQEAEIAQWRKEQEAILNDPHASEEDKRFARRILGVEPA